MICAEPVVSMMGQKDGKLSNCICIFGKPVALAG